VFCPFHNILVILLVVVVHLCVLVALMLVKFNCELSQLLMCGLWFAMILFAYHELFYELLTDTVLILLIKSRSSC